MSEKVEKLRKLYRELSEKHGDYYAYTTLMKIANEIEVKKRE